MPILKFPAEGLRYVQLPGGAFAAGRTGVLYAQDGSTPAVVYADNAGVPGALIPGSSITLDSNGGQPDYWFNGDWLYGRFNGGPLVRIDAAYDPRLDTLEALQPSGTIAEDQNLAAWTFDPALALSSTGPLAGALVLSRLQIRTGRTLGNVWLAVSTAGVALTAGQNLAGLYSSTGALVAVTADQSTAWASTGVKTAPFVLPYAATPGAYWVGILSNATTSTPSFARSGAGAVSGVSSAGLAATAARFGSYGSAQTALPGQLTLASITIATNGTFWAGVS